MLWELDILKYTVAQIHVDIVFMSICWLDKNFLFHNSKYNIMSQVFTLKYITQYAPVFND